MRSMLFCAALALLSGTHALAQQFPSRPIVIITPFAPGGPVDFIARATADKLGPALGHVIVENRPGAGGYIGGEFVARAAPDGYTLLCNVLEGVHTQLFTKDQPVVLAHELTAFAEIAFAPNMYIGPAAGAKNLREFIAAAKSSPKSVNASLIPGNVSALETLNFLKQQGLDVLAVPYNSMAPVVTALARGEVQLYLATVGSAKPFIDGGRVRGLAVFSEQRLPAVPDVPTLKEQGLSYSIIDGINYSLFAPLKTPASITRLLNEEVVAAMQTTDLRELLAKQGFVVGTPSAEQWQAKFTSLTQAVEKAAKDYGIVPQ